MRSRDAWLGTITTSSTISSLPSTSGTARWNASTACPTAWATSSSCARRTTASMTPVAGLPKTAGTSTTTTVSGRYCLEKVCKSIFFLSLYSAKITYTLFRTLPKKYGRFKKKVRTFFETFRCFCYSINGCCS